MQSYSASHLNTLKIHSNGYTAVIWMSCGVGINAVTCLCVETEGWTPILTLKTIEDFRIKDFKRFQCSDLNRQHAAEGGGGSRKKGSVIYHFCHS